MKNPPASAKPVNVYLARYYGDGRRTQASALRCIARDLFPGVPADEAPWETLTYERVVTYRDGLRSRVALATANRYLCALRGILRTVRLMGLTLDNGTLVNALEPFKGTVPLAGRALNVEQVATMINEALCEERRRDATLLAILYGTGCRIAEAVALRRKDWLGDRLVIRGKGNRERVVPLPETIVTYLVEYVVTLGPVTPDTRLFPFNRRKANRIVAKYAAAVGLKASPHDLRRTYITELLDKGIDLFLVGRLAGHQYAGTTARYDRRPFQRLVAAVRDLPRLRSGTADHPSPRPNGEARAGS